jgi:hypothetical protein
MEASTSAAYTERLERRILQLEKEIAALASKPAHVHIETLHVHQPVLDSLTFRLDSLDIGELSGSLNLGNNFGAKSADLSAQRDASVKAGSTPKAKPTTQAPGTASGPTPDASASEPQISASPAAAPEAPVRKPQRSAPPSSEAAETPVRTTTGYRVHPKASPPS